MALDVVVVNYKTPDLLREFIKSYEQNTFNDCTLTVVDVQSTRSDLQFITRYGGPWISTEMNIGYGKACNVGAQFGKNDAILLANADTLLTSGLKECYNALMSREDWGVLGPRQVNQGGHLTAGGIFAFLGSDRIPRQRGWNDRDKGQCSDVRDDALTVSGALYFIKREVWDGLTNCPIYKASQPEATGAFLETKLYYEETFCSYHARAHGYKCVYYGPVQMIHHWHASVSSGQGWKDDQMQVSLKMYREACRQHNILCE